MIRTNPIAKDLRTPKYRSRVVKDKRKEKARRACREEGSMSSKLEVSDFQDWVERQDDGWYVRRVCSNYHHEMAMTLGPFRSELHAKIALDLLGPYPIMGTTVSHE